MSFRFKLALLAGKLSIPVLKITKHNGTNFPGKLAIKICPDFLDLIDRPEHIITVTGTNGKTTVCNLLIDALEASGREVLNNRAGSNINSGIATAFMQGVGFDNKCKYTWGVLEVDERSSKKIYSSVVPEMTVITNLFRDSIMRNAHPGYIADILTSSIPASTKLILNADDLISSSVAPSNERVYFGIRKMPTDVKECINHINDIQICPKCQGRLRYEYLRYHHIGKSYCEMCNFKSPSYDYVGDRVDTDNMTMTISDRNGTEEYSLISDSVFNIYNLVTTVTVLRELDMSHKEIKRILSSIHIVETRFLDEQVGDIRIVMQMAKDKNALACSRALDYVSGLPGEKEIVLMMHNFGDEIHWSENTCWMYDCDFEFLAKDNITHIVATGPRSKDYRLRLLMAGVPDERIECVRDELEAANHLHLKKKTGVYIFYGTDGLKTVFSFRDKVIALAKEKA